MTRVKKLKSPRLAVDVTQEDIDLSIPKSSEHCMISDAIKRAFPAAAYITTDLATIRFTDKGKGLRYIWLTPVIAQQNLLDFDHEIKPQPFAFKLGRAAQIVRSGISTARNPKIPADDPLRKKRLQREAGNCVPTVVGGAPPPVSRVGHGKGFSAARTHSFRTGRRREFGLRAMGV